MFDIFERTIINSFFPDKKQGLADIVYYVESHISDTLDADIVKVTLNSLVANSTVVCASGMYSLTEKGAVILDDNLYYSVRKLTTFYKVYVNGRVLRRVYEEREVRKEQRWLREFLTANKPHLCIICDKRLPLCLLETAHIKPRSVLNRHEIMDTNVVEFMCRYCHKLYDEGMLGIDNQGVLTVSEVLRRGAFDVEYVSKVIKAYNEVNAVYFRHHWKYVFKQMAQN